MFPIKARTLALWDEVRSSYWFIPSLMTLGAAGLSVVLVGVDSRISPEWIEAVPGLVGNRPSGARAVLTTIAGSMIGVAGVTFSITIASVVYATGQYGPRLLSNFMADRGNQVTLGTFIATFLYCLLVLRTIVGEDAARDAFVPHVATLGGLALALASVGVLIFFLHHVPESIHVSNLVAGLGRELAERVDVRFPSRIGEGAGAEDVSAPALPPGGESADEIRADGAGYVTGVDAETLLEVAVAHGLVVRVRRRPGDFVAAGDGLAAAWPADRVTEEVRRRIREAFAWGRQRTARQDVRFLIDELVEIAGRALSPGVNDPFTAMTCLDWLSAALKQLGTRDALSPVRTDAEGAVRVVAHPATFGDFVDAVYGQLRPYLAADRNAALHALQTLGEIGGRTADPGRRAVLLAQADAIAEGAERALTLAADREAVRQRHGVVARVLRGLEPFDVAADRSPWLGGSA